MCDLTYFEKQEWTDVNSTKPHCQDCDPKADCRGKDVVESIDGYWRFQPDRWDDDFEYLDSATCRAEGDPCLFPDQGYVPLGGWSQGPMTCSRLAGGGDRLYCARPLSDAKATRRKSGGGGGSSSNSVSPAGVHTAKEFGNETDAASVMVIRCPVGACGKNNTCLGNRTGPVCGFCLPGFMMETAGCSNQKCPSDEDLLPWRITFFTCCGASHFGPDWGHV